MTEAPMDITLRYLTSETDRFGNVRLYVRRFGRRIRIREVPGSAAFLDAYQKALDELAPAMPAPPDAIGQAKQGTMGALARAYFATGISAQARQIIEHCLREPVAIDDPSSPLMSAVQIEDFGTKHGRVLRDRKSDLPGAANNRVKYLSAMFGWAVENDHAPANPMRDVKPVKYATDGFHTWTREEVGQYEARHPVGTKARLALALLLFTGARRGDVVTFGRQHVRDGKLRYVPRKTRHKRAKALVIPVLPALAEIIAESPCGDLTFLVTEYGRPFTSAGFGGKFRDWCDQAGLPQCTAHGLRKAGATILAEHGATAHQLMAIFGWSTITQATTYTAAADQEKLAGALSILSHPDDDGPKSETEAQGRKKTST